MNKDRIWTLLSRKLSGEATPAELKELSELIEINPGIDLTVHYINAYWDVPAEKDEDFLEATFLLHLNRLKDQGVDLELNNTETGSLNLYIKDKDVAWKNKSRVFISLAFLILVGAFTIYSFINKSVSAVPEKDALTKSEVSTKNGSRSTKIQLPDGTMVWLNSSSKLTYDNEHFGSGIREVSLTGEAYFDVVKNPAKPFIIHTAKLDIKVLGTAFNVKCYPNEKNTETSLIRGSIEVTLKDRQEKIVMKPNEKLIISNDELRPDKELAKTINKTVNTKAKPIIELGHLNHYPTDNSIVETGWVENRLVFSSETLDEIVIKMERWYGVNIRIEDEKLKKELLTGIFEEETINQALAAMKLTTPFNYKIEKDLITISK